MNPTKSYFKDTCHPLYNRGVNKANVFYDEQDYAYFVKRLSPSRQVLSQGLRRTLKVLGTFRVLQVRIPHD